MTGIQIEVDIPIKLSDYQPFVRTENDRTYRKIVVVEFTTKVKNQSIPSRSVLMLEEGLIVRDRIQARVDDYNMSHFDHMTLTDIKAEICEC